MPDGHMTAAERGSRMLREGGYVRHREGADIHHPDAAEDKNLIHEELGKAKITPGRNKGGKIKGKAAGDHPGRRHRAHGGSVTNEQHPPGDDEQNSKLARGGRSGGAGHKGGIGKVNIVIAHPGEGAGTSPMAGAPPMAAPPRPSMPPPAAPPPPRPPMMPPPGGMPGGGMPPGPPIGGAPRPPMPPPGAGASPMMRPQGIRTGGSVRDRNGRFAGGAI